MRFAANNLLNLLLLSGLSCPLVLFGQDSLNISGLGTFWSFWDSEAYDEDGGEMLFDGQFAYLCNGRGGLRLLEVQGDTNLIETGYFVPSTDYSNQVRDVAVRDTMAYLSTNQGLYVLDISDRSAPVAVQFVDTFPSWASLLMHGNYLLAYTLYEILAYDLTDPAQPELFASAWDDNKIWDIESDGEFLYLLRNGLHVYSISADGEFELEAHVPAASGGEIVLDGNYAYINRSDGVRAVDISDPLAPIDLGTIILDSQSRVSIAVHDGLLVWTTGSWNRLVFWDVSNILAPSSLGTSEPWSYFSPNAIKFSDGIALVRGSFSGLNLIDISVPPTAHLLDQMEEEGPCEAIAIHEQTMLAATSEHGLIVADISNPHAPAETAQIKFGSQCKAVAISGDVALAGFDNYGLVTYDLADANPPPQLGELPLNTRFTGITAGDGFAVLWYEYWFAQVVSIVNPAEPVALGHLLDENGDDVEFDNLLADGNIVYGTNWHGLWRFDLSDPSTPVLLDVTRLRYANAIATHGNTVAVAHDDSMTWERRVSFFDILRPGAPVLIATADVPNDTAYNDYARSLEWRGDILLYQATQGVLFLDTRDLTNLELQSFHYGLPYTYSMAFAGTTLYRGRAFDVEMLDVTQAIAAASLAPPAQVTVAFLNEALLLRWLPVTHDAFGQPVTPLYRIWGSPDPLRAPQDFTILGETTSTLFQLGINADSSPLMSIFVTAE